MQLQAEIAMSVAGKLPKNAEIGMSVAGKLPKNDNSLQGHNPAWQRKKTLLWARGGHHQGQNLALNAPFRDNGGGGGGLSRKDVPVHARTTLPQPLHSRQALFTDD